MADDFSDDGKETNPGKPGRAAWSPSVDQRTLVRQMTADGAGHEAIADALEISVPTLRKYCGDELRDRMGAHNLFAAAGDVPPVVAQASPPAKRAGAGGRKRYQPLARDRQRVAALIASGMTVADVARALELSEPTLRRHFRPDLETGAVRKRAEVVDAVFRAAIKGSVAAQKLALELIDKADLGALSRNLGKGAASTPGAEPPRPAAIGKKEQADHDARDVMATGAWSFLTGGDQAH